MTTYRAATCRRFAAITFVNILALFVYATAAEQTPASVDTDAWQFEITPYIFGAGLKGKTGITTSYGNITADVDKSFGDILDNLDSGFMGLFEARNGKWSFAVEGVYFKIKNEHTRSWQGPNDTTGSARLDATMAEQLYQLTTTYRVHDEATRIDVIGAARYTQLDVDLNLALDSGADLLPDGSRAISGARNWWDPVIGVRVLQPIAENWTFVGVADIGGFGVGSDFTYQLLGGVNWQFAKSWTARAGYRSLYQDYDDGFIWDMTASGIYLGAGFQF